MFLKLVKYLGVVFGVVLLLNTSSYAGDFRSSVSSCTNSIKDSMCFRVKCIDVNAKDKDGNTPLHLSLDQNNLDLDLIRLLIERGANVNAKNNLGQTPIERLFSNKYNCSAQLDMKIKINASRVLLENGAYLDVKSNMCQLIEENILFNGGKDLVVLMFEKNVNLKGQLSASNCGWLHKAVLKNRKDVVEVLLESGANINARNDKEETPLHIAVSNNYKDIAWVLLNFDAK